MSRDDKDRGTVTPVDETGVPRDLPDAPENVTAYLFGFYVGFVTWRFAFPTRPHMDRNAYFYLGYIMGWVVKAVVVVWLAQTAIPDVSGVVKPVATTAAALGTAAFLLLKSKFLFG